MIHQPKDRNHLIYQLIDEYLIDGDQKIIALELNVKAGMVSRVKCGKARSVRIWEKIIEKVMERKKNEDRFIKTMKKEAA